MSGSPRLFDVTGLKQMRSSGGQPLPREVHHFGEPIVIMKLALDVERVGQKGLEQHAEESQSQQERLQQVFDSIGKSARGKTCESIQGLMARA